MTCLEANDFNILKKQKSIVKCIQFMEYRVVPLSFKQISQWY